MVFTAITYTTLAVKPMFDAQNRLRSVTVMERATAAGGESGFSCPSDTSTTVKGVTKVWEYLKGHNYRLVHWSVWAASLTGTQMLAPVWSDFYPVYPYIYGGSQIIAQYETAIIPIEIGVRTAGASNTPVFLGSMSTGTLTASDAFVTTMVFEVVV